MVLISFVGTFITDNITDHFGVPLQVTTAIFIGTLATVFAVWYVSDRALSIHTILTARREAYYWLVILFTFALGTVTGDLLVETLHLGYLNSAMICGAGIALVAAARLPFRTKAILSF